MVVADSGVWIDFFNGRPNPARDVLRRLLREGDTRIVVPDLVLFEVLRGFRGERELRQAEALMGSLSVEPTGSVSLALQAARHYRGLRERGITVRSGIDVLVATFCIERDYLLLHRDRDYLAFEQHRGLRGWRH
ncbi:MAG: PIN domain nuclease [Rubrivivax sp.]|nr:PIN domain nuclease [Rubrivivax sp.]